MIEKPGKPVQTIAILESREEAGFDLLTSALQTFAQEEQAKSQIKEAKAAIAQLEAFVNGLPA